MLHCELPPNYRAAFNFQTRLSHHTAFENWQLCRIYSTALGVHLSYRQAGFNRLGLPEISPFGLIRAFEMRWPSGIRIAFTTPPEAAVPENTLYIQHISSKQPVIRGLRIAITTLISI